MKRGTLTLKKSIALLVTLCAMLFLTGAGTSSVQKNYESGLSLMEQGKYQEAAEKFQAMGSYEEASRLLMYCRAVVAAEGGDYAAASQAFLALGSFRDAAAMLPYYDARQAEAEGRSSLAIGDTASAIQQLNTAAESYASLSGLRDADSRQWECYDLLYQHGRDLLSEGRFETARDVFDALGNLNDCPSLKTYCEACLLDAEGSYLRAARMFAQIPSVLDSETRATSVLDSVYQQAVSLSSTGELEEAINLFAELGSFRDAASRQNEIVGKLLHERLRQGDYEGALLLLDTAPDAVPLQAVGDTERQVLDSFLTGFVDAYLHFSAGSMDSYSGYYGLLPYIEADGALDNRFRQVLMIGSYSHNSNYIFYGCELLDAFRLEEGFVLSYVRASASVLQPVGQREVTRTFRIITHSTDAGLAAGFIEDCTYGQASPTGITGHPVITGPLPDGVLPADEDGDGIVIVDVMKKGFNGTMIIVKDPSRVFVGGPGFYGGNGMLLDELVHRYDALGGINGGGFIDEDGGGSGGLPEGLTILDGQSYHWAGSGASAAFDENDILHVGYYSIESAAAAHIRDCVSFGPALIVNGVGEYGDYMQSGINPRTAIGQRSDGVVLLLCIDGRQLHSIGANFGDLRDVMLDFGAVNACSLDGGSSTVMYYDGEYMNSPSSASGTSRYLPNAFLIRK